MDAIFDGGSSPPSSPPESEFAFFFVMDSSGIRMEIYLDFWRGIYEEAACARSVKFVLCCVERG